MEGRGSSQYRRGGSKLSRGGYVDHRSHKFITLMIRTAHIEKSDPHPHQSKKKDPDAHCSASDQLLLS